MAWKMWKALFAIGDLRLKRIKRGPLRIHRNGPLNCRRVGGKTSEETAAGKDSEKRENRVCASKGNNIVLHKERRQLLLKESLLKEALGYQRKLVCQ